MKTLLWSMLAAFLIGGGVTTCMDSVEVVKPKQQRIEKLS